MDYVYNIGKYEVTAGQYTEFLNAVAATDTYGLYNPSMWSSEYGCMISRTGSSPDFRYSVAPDWADRPVNYVDWVDAARFVNWLHNGQPTGAQTFSTTEDGAYYLNGGMGAPLGLLREEDATWVLPSEDEWYKAAYYDGGNGRYYDYPMGTDDRPSHVLSDPEPDPGNNGTFGSGTGQYTIGSPYYRTKQAAHENSASPYGTFDQGGNVWEWNEATQHGVSPGFRGGSFRYADYALHAAARDFGSPEHYTGGFRVAEVPRSKSDIDFDGDVDLHDFDSFEEMNLREYALFQAAFTGGQ